MPLFQACVPPHDDPCWNHIAVIQFFVCERGLELQYMNATARDIFVQNLSLLANNNLIIQGANDKFLKNKYLKLCTGGTNG